MAVEAQFYSENLGLPSLYGFQDWTFNPVSGVGDDLCCLLHSQPLDQFIQMVSSSSSSSCNSFLVHPLNPHQLVLQQSQEIDSILQSQNEKLRLALHEQRKLEMTAILNSLETKTLRLMKQKEEDLETARKKSMELQEWLKKAETEREIWERLAKAKEAMVIDLNKAIEKAREELGFLVNNYRTEDADSCCEREDRIEEKVDKKMRNLACRNCNSRSSCVLFLPCRHLCSCKSCEAFLGYCPVCLSVKQASLEVFLV